MLGPPRIRVIDPDLTTGRIRPSVKIHNLQFQKCAALVIKFIATRNITEMFHFTLKKYN